MKRTMKEVVDEYNLLAKADIKRFATVDIGEKKIAAIKNAKPTAKPTATSHMRITAGGKQYRSVAAAFEELKLPMGKHIRFRGQLRAEKEKLFEHDGRKITFKIIEQDD